MLVATTQVVAGVIVSAIAGILLIRFQSQLVAMSPARLFFLGSALLLVAILLSVLPSYLSTDILNRLTAGVRRQLVFTYIDAIVVCMVVGCIFIVTRRRLQPSTMETYIAGVGPLLGLIGVGGMLIFDTAESYFGSGDFGSNFTSSAIWKPIAWFVASILVLWPKQAIKEGMPSGVALLRAVMSMTCGNIAFSYTQGYVAGYFKGVANVLGGG
jgi:hypothetical protein